MNFRKLLMLTDDGLAMVAAMQAVVSLANAFSPFRLRFVAGEGAGKAVNSSGQILVSRFFIEDASRSGEES
jgi:hypothetical protein